MDHRDEGDHEAQRDFHHEDESPLAVASFSVKKERHVAVMLSHNRLCNLHKIFPW